MSLADIPSALAELRLGKPVIVADDEGRENEGDVIISAQMATQEWLAWTVRYSSGFICAPMTNELADKLNLPIMVPNNEDPRGTNYTISVDAADRLSTGISAADRAHTLRVLADPASTPRPCWCSTSSSPSAPLARPEVDRRITSASCCAPVASGPSRVSARSCHGWSCPPRRDPSRSQRTQVASTRANPKARSSTGAKTRRPPPTKATLLPPMIASGS